MKRKDRGPEQVKLGYRAAQLEGDKGRARILQRRVPTEAPINYRPAAFH